MSTVYTTAWGQDIQPQAYTSDNYSFSAPLDCSVSQQNTHQTSMFMLGPSSDPSAGAAPQNSWWEMAGEGTVGVDAGSGDWQPATGYDSDSTCVTNGHCTTPESDEGWMSSGSTEVAQLGTDPFSATGLDMNPAVGIYAPQPQPLQMPFSESCPKEAYLQHPFTTDPVAIGPMLHVQGQTPTLCPAPTTGCNLLKTKAPVPKKRSVAASGHMGPVKTVQVTAEATSVAVSPKLAAPDQPAATDGNCCPFCKAAFAGGEAGAIPVQEQGGSKKKAKSNSGGEEIRQRCFRNRKDARRHNRQGKWWSSVGYNGEPYCQRCSEIFRDHIIRTMSNSANCTREHPCHDCEQILRCFTGGRENAFIKMEERRSNAAPGHNGPYKRRKRGQR
eukprot:COSAG02_NODE_607_length_19608_cov_33.568968_14_plen_386_part_00